MRKLVVAGSLALAFTAAVYAQSTMHQGTMQGTKPTGTTGVSSGADASALTQIEQDWADAAAKGDVARLEKIFAPDYVQVDPMGNLTTREASLSGMNSGSMKIESWDQSEIQPRVYGNAAVVTGVSTIKGTYGSNDISGKYRWTDTYVKENGQWKCVSSQVTKIAQSQ